MFATPGGAVFTWLLKKSVAIRFSGPFLFDHKLKESTMTVVDL